jgi:glycerol uptake facilitator-like aquaporin
MDTYFWRAVLMERLGMIMFIFAICMVVVSGATYPLYAQQMPIPMVFGLIIFVLVYFAAGIRCDMTVCTLHLLGNDYHCHGAPPPHPAVAMAWRPDVNAASCTCNSLTLTACALVCRAVFTCDNSGANFNPAVSLMLIMGKRISVVRAVLYIMAQVRLTC